MRVIYFEVAPADRGGDDSKAAVAVAVTVGSALRPAEQLAVKAEPNAATRAR